MKTEPPDVLVFDIKSEQRREKIKDAINLMNWAFKNNRFYLYDRALGMLLELQR